jgi:transaldolase
MGLKIFADGADKASILELNKNPLVQGFTTNPSLLRKAGVTDYKTFALDILSVIKDKPVSFEVIADDIKEMWNQSLEIASWGENVFVKIPITSTKGELNQTLVGELSGTGVKLNITAITTIEQVKSIMPYLDFLQESYISIFAGRIADTGVDPLPTIANALSYIKKYSPSIKLIWASPREVYNIYQAEWINCDIITCTPDLIKKYELLKGKDLTEYSLDTVQMFYNDAIESGLTL